MTAINRVRLSAAPPLRHTWAVAGPRGDVVPATPGGRAAGVCSCSSASGSIALLTAVAASAILVGEVSAEEERTDSEECAIENEQAPIFVRLAAIDARLQRIETAARARGGQRRRSQNRPDGFSRP